MDTTSSQNSSQKQGAETSARVNSSPESHPLSLSLIIKKYRNIENYRYVNRENLPSDMRIPLIRKVLDELKASYRGDDHDVDHDASQVVDVALTREYDVQATSAKSRPISKE